MSLGKNIKKQKLIPDQPVIEKKVERKAPAKKEKTEPNRSALRTRYTEELKLLKSRRLQLIIFSVGSTSYALEIAQAQEVLVTPVITPSPYYPESVKGVMEVRGKMVIALDLESKFRFKKEDEDFPYTLLVKNKSDQHIGILLRDVPFTLKIDGANLIAADGLMASMAHQETYIKCVIKSPQGLIYLLDINELIQHEQLPEIR